jgi:predicted MFS family arabinose efflux permease
MHAGVPQVKALQALTRDGWLLFATRFLRLFGYGLISVVLVLYLDDLGLSDFKIGALLSLTLLGDTIVSLWITTRADRLGRRRMLIVGSWLIVLGGVAFAMSESFAVLLIAATVAVISPSGGEVGPFLSIEQASLSHLVSAERRTDVFAWYNLTGSVATALGALLGGLSVNAARQWGLSNAASYRPALLAYAVIGGLLSVVFAKLSHSIEISGSDSARPRNEGMFLGLHRSRQVVFRLSALFALDAFGGGFIMQSILAYWLHVRFGMEAAALGGVFLGANLLAGVSALAAGWLAQRFGLVNTMVFTHLPANVLLMLVPLMPSAEWAVALLLIRYSISQMDVPTRQAYTMAVVSPDERSAASGVTAVARSLGAVISPAIATRLIAVPALVSVPLFLAGGIKIVYDLVLWRAVASHVPNEEPRA